MSEIRTKLKELKNFKQRIIDLKRERQFKAAELKTWRLVSTVQKELNAMEERYHRVTKERF